MKLNVLKRYRNNSVYYRAGSSIEVDDDYGVWLMADAPGCFEEDRPKKAAPRGKSGKR